MKKLVYPLIFTGLMIMSCSVTITTNNTNICCRGNNACNLSAGELTFEIGKDAPNDDQYYYKGGCPKKGHKDLVMNITLMIIHIF